MELIGEIHGWLSGLQPGAVYAVLFLIAYFENLVPPVPGDVATVVAGMVAAAGAVSLTLVVILAGAAGGLGFLTLYAVGRRFDDLLDDPRRLRWLPRADIRRAEDKVARFGYAVVAVNRFLPGLRAVISVTVGMSRLAAGPVAVLATASATVWAALIAYLGYALVDNREALARILGGFERAGLVISIAVGLALAAWLWRVRRRRSAGGQETAKTPEP
jgi:membrane protein DedA with SNARE-associated domain